MAAAFPTTPSNGDLATVNNIIYQYASATQSWTRVLTPVYQVANNLSALTFATANGNANLSIAGTPVVTWAATGEYITGIVSATGNVTAGNIIAGGARSTTQSSTPPSNPTVGDIWYNSATDVMYRYTYDGTSSYWIDEFSSAVGNGGATGGYYIANGASSITTNYNDNANVTINGVSNVAVFTTTGINASNVSVAGNVTAANLVFTTQVSGTGTITTSGNIIGGNITITNVFNPASVSTSGNVTGANLIASTGNLTGNLFSGVTNNGLIINYNTTSGAANIGPNSTGGSTSLYFGTSNAGTFTNKVQIDNLGNVWPTANATQDLGSNTLRWRSIYTSDLDLNNGIGDWTIVEGEDDLFLYNNRKGKTYKFALIEVDPSTAPPKINDLRK